MIQSTFQSIFAGAAALVLTALSPAVAQPEAVDSGTAVAPAVQYARIGIVPLRDESDIRNGAADLASMLAGRLGERFKSAEFIEVDPGIIGLEHGPVLLEEAVELGAEYGCDALLDGVFGGVEIVGGTWPNTASDTPQARGELTWRLVECSAGRLVVDGTVKPLKPKVYSARIRSSEQLIRRVMQEMVAVVGDELEEGGWPAGTSLPSADEEVK